ARRPVDFRARNGDGEIDLREGGERIVDLIVRPARFLQRLADAGAGLAAFERGFDEIDKIGVGHRTSPRSPPSLPIVEGLKQKARSLSRLSGKNELFQGCRSLSPPERGLRPHPTARRKTIS